MLKVQRVLVVDDHVDTAEALKLLLCWSGREVRIAHRGHEAIELARELEPDLAIVDLRLPDMSGIDVAQALRRVCSRPPVVFALSGCARRLRDDPRQFDRSLLKPIDAETLFQGMC